MNVTTDLLAQLTADGDTVALDDTRTLVLHIERDDDADYNDDEGLGKIQFITDDGRRRPDGFTGAARKISVYYGTYWWEPYRDGHTVYDGPDDIKQVWRLLEDGYRYVALELRETLTDSHGREHVVTVDRAGLGGIDSLEDGYLAEVIEELAAELPIDI